MAFSTKYLPKAMTIGFSPTATLFFTQSLAFTYITKTANPLFFTCIGQKELTVRLGYLRKRPGLIMKINIETRPALGYDGLHPSALQNDKIIKSWIKEREKMLTGKKIGVIGGGVMGGALVQGIVLMAHADSELLTVADMDEKRLQELADRFNVNVTTDNREAMRGADVLILSVKPQKMDEVLAGLDASLAPNMTCITIAAGIATSFIEERLRRDVRVIRVMPNMPAQIGEGAAALCRGSHATDRDMDVAREIFEAVGTTVEVKEEMMDAVTALSGSGPGYAFYILEAFAEAGVRMGFDWDASLKLVSQSFLGAAKLCLKGEKHPAELKSMVATPGGTTIAGLKVMEDGRLSEMIASVVEEATIRSAELGGRKYIPPHSS
jgi:pyrroline-5-carboxylate reductase